MFMPSDRLTTCRYRRFGLSLCHHLQGHEVGGHSVVALVSSSYKGLSLTNWFKIEREMLK